MCELLVPGVDCLKDASVKLKVTGLPSILKLNNAIWSFHTLLLF